MTLAITVAVCANWSCSKSSGNTGSTNPNTPTPVANVQLATSTTFGSVLTDSLGKTLYFFAIDANGSSGCSGPCIAAWPVFYKKTVSVGSGLDTGDFRTITRGDGSMQTTYKGWPLYYFANDSKAGDINGDAVGNSWFVAKPDYTVMVANTQLVGLDGNDYDDHYNSGEGVTQYITDDRGRTLYAFSHDKNKTNTFTKPDFSNNSAWPCDTIPKVMNIPSILDRSQFDTVMLYGKIQLSYKGWPLYYFGKDDDERGSTKGVSAIAPGTWPVVNGNSPAAPM